MGDDKGFRRAGWPQGLKLAADRAADHDEERNVFVADLDQYLSPGDRTAPPARRNARHLRARQRRKQPFRV
jgi:hypothetical protein